MIGTHWISLYVNNDNGRASYNRTYLHCFGVEHIPKKIEKFLGKKNIMTNIDRIHAFDSIMCGYLCTGFIDFMWKDKSLFYIIQFYFFLMNMKRTLKQS